MTHLLSYFDASPYVAPWELDGKEVTVTIDRVVKKEVVGDGGKKAMKPVAHFRDWEKPLCFGKKVAKVLIKLYGADPDAYAGKRITLFATQDKGPSGEKVDCVRIRDVVPKPTAPAPTLQVRAARLESALTDAEGTEAIDAVWTRAAQLRAALEAAEPKLLESLTETYSKASIVASEKEEAERERPV